MSEALLEHPLALSRLRVSPAQWPAVVEELLRYDGPVETSTTRWAGRDTSFAGQTMQRGDVIRPVLASANRDNTVFAASDQLDLDRPDNRHLAFGLGIHYCLGAPLARLEGRLLSVVSSTGCPGCAAGIRINRLPGAPGYYSGAYSNCP
jgi:cytochrome P450